jgi:hypothetical protein
MLVRCGAVWVLREQHQEDDPSEAYIHTYIYTYIYIHTYLHTHLHAFVYAKACMCAQRHKVIYIYIYIHTHTHTYIYIYIFTHTLTCICICKHVCAHKDTKLPEQQYVPPTTYVEIRQASYYGPHSAHSLHPRYFPHSRHLHSSDPPHSRHLHSSDPHSRHLHSSDPRTLRLRGHCGHGCDYRDCRAYAYVPVMPAIGVRSCEVAMMTMMMMREEDALRRAAGVTVVILGSSGLCAAEWPV